MTSISPPTLSLPEIASWQFPELLNTLETSKPQIIAAIPSLQRGAVWKPGQVEMLWDSILRGFPIGALVMCPKFEGQDYHSGKHGKGWADEQVTHYLLDGQQRCNAVALGFLDALQEVDGKQPPATLWIDLNPAITKNSTRQFVLRVLTISHPWGYGLDDDAGFIGVADIRDAVDEYADGKRPAITAAWPYLSKCPVPFSWLIRTVFQKAEAAGLWELILGKCRSDEVKDRSWAKKAAEFIEAHLESPQSTSHLKRIEAALRRMRQFRLVALEVPQEILQQESFQEAMDETSQAEGDQRIHNVEHLFQRLNSSGTELRGEELLFSMIKAYWPAIEKSFAEIRDGHGNAFLPMPGSRLASLGVRAALMSLQDKPALQASPKIQQIRSLAFPKDEKTREHCGLIKKYLGIPVKGGDHSEMITSESDLHKNLRQVDSWLLFDSTKQDDIGLPPVLRSNLAQSAPDVYLLLLHLAQRARRERLSDEVLTTLKKPILGLVTALHWFGLNQDEAVRQVLAELDKLPLSSNSFDGLLVPCMAAGSKLGVLNILSPKELSDLIKPVHETDPRLHAWTLWRRLVEIETDDPIAKQKAETMLLPFIQKTIHSRPLLLYVQRSYLRREFSSYDPSCVDVWKGHDRPWDYDHLLPSAVLASNRGTYREACRQWVNTIGNFRAWSLEKNRGRQDGPAKQCIQSAEFADSLIKDQQECDDFSMLWAEVVDPTKAARFMNAARARTLRIYKNWFDSLEISRLLAVTREN